MIDTKQTGLRLLAALILATGSPAMAAATVVIAPSPRFDLPATMAGNERILASIGPHRAADRGRVAAASRGFVAVGRRVIAPSAPEALPETATWLTMILGFFGLSHAVRRRHPSPARRMRFV